MEVNLMDYYNPFMRMQPMAQPMNNQMSARTPIDPQQFRQFAITLNDTALNNFAQMARMQGISEQDIQEGIRYIKSL